MAIPISSSLTQLNAEVFLQEGFELSLDAIVPSIELTGSFSTTTSKTQLYLYNFSKDILYENLNYNANGSYRIPEENNININFTSSYNQFELTPVEDVYNQGYSSGKFYTVYNFIDYELGSEVVNKEKDGNFEQHPYFLKEISGDRTELRIQNNYLNYQQIESYYNQFITKLDARENADEFYVSFGNNRNFIGVNSLLETEPPNSPNPTSILIKLYQPLPTEFKVEDQLQVITKVGETQAFEVEFSPNLEYVENLLSLKGPNYNIDIKDRVNNSTNFKNLNDLINTNSSQSYYQFNSLQDQKGIILRKNWGDWNEFVKYSSAEQRLNNFYDKMVSIESYEAEIVELETIGRGTTASIDYSSSYNAVSSNINSIISKFDSYEYFLYYITGSESWPKSSTTYPYTNYSVTSSAILNWFGSTNESSAYYNSGKNQIYSASRYDNNNQDYLYYLIPPYITENNSNDQYIKFVNMTGQAFDEMYIYTEAVEQVRNTNSSLTGSILSLGLADEVIESLGFNTYANDFNSIGFNVNGVGVFPATGSGLEYIDRYVDIASGSVINYYDQQQSTLGYVIALADPSFPYPIDNAAQEIYKRIFHNMISLVKRKGTVTGLRQLINIWGVPSTMLRISEFGGKNKDDENDYDLWMNRYSTALTTYNYKIGATEPSCSIRIPWTPLTSNFVANNGSTPTQDVAVPDCIQFRFKNKRPIYSDSLFTSSLLVNNSVDGSSYSDFGIVLQYSGSDKGSYSGAILPTDSQYGTIQFVISGSVSQGANSPGFFETDPISLPFFNNDWWSVQLQRKIHISASNEDSTLNEYELTVANNIYDGYDGNQIGFIASSSITMPGSKITSSINEAWNKFKDEATLPMDNGTILGGYMNLDASNGDRCKLIGSATGRSLGSGFSGSFQEFRYYRRALSSSQFNDYVMNPESIQGHANSNTGSGSSYDLLSFRLPLGNELEYTNVKGTASLGTLTENTGIIGILKFGGQNNVYGSQAFGSLHPSLVNKKGSLYTSSFLYTTSDYTGSGYNLVFQGWDGLVDGEITASYLEPITEINYMDQPSAGIRNRIKNKIQVIDGNEYGTTLSPFRSIQQEFEQSSSYTEDLNSLEVGFSFQNEINDDIIATFGHGVVSDAIADPRFISESSDRYPELTRIAEDYFKKYQGYTITDPRYTGLPTVIEQEYDYNRLIKFYETSLFKAIKNYVPARTSLSTGIIVKQHLLERNKTDAVIGMHTETPLAKTPETGSNSWGYTTQTGFNSVIANKNLLITSSIAVGSLTGSAGGSVNKYNILTDEGAYYHLEGTDIVGISSTPVNLFPDTKPGGGSTETKIFLEEDVNGDVYLESTVALSSQVRLNMLFDGTPGSPADIKLETTSSKRGGIWDYTFENIAIQNPPGLVSTNFITVYPDERLYFYISSDVVLTMDNHSFTLGEDVDNFIQPEPSASQQVNWYIDDYTGEWKVDDYQTEFYNGEYSGSNTQMIPAQYNPYRIYADGDNKNPDTLLPYTPPTLDLGAGTYSTARFPSGVTTTSATAVAVRATASLVYPSGSSTGGSSPSSDSLLLRAMGSQADATKIITLISTDLTQRTYVNIGNTSPLYTSHSTNANNGKYLLQNGEDIYDLASTSFTNLLGTAIGPITYSVIFTRTSPTSDALSFTVDVTLENQIAYPVVITNVNTGAVNGTLWVEVGDVFTSATFSPQNCVGTCTITSAGLTNGLLLVQFNNDGTTTIGNGGGGMLALAIASSKGHNGKILATERANGSDVYLELKQLTLGTAGNTAITHDNDFADNSSGVCLISVGSGASPTYYFPTTFQGGVNELSTNTKYLQNAITGLTPGVTYEISFDITGYADDGLDGSTGAVGMSSLDNPSGTANGVGMSIRATSNGTVTGTWIQAAGTTTAMFLAHPGVYATISNVVITPPVALLAPKYFYPRDGFTILPTQSVLFSNSPYNPIINNVTGSRKNSFLFDMDFDPVGPGTTLKEGIPSDYSLLVSASQLGFEGTATNDDLLEFSEIPDSNYTIKSVINPRYNGSKMISADYNFGISEMNLSESAAPNTIVSPLRTPSLRKQSKITFLNGDTGSWEGDSTNEYPSAIDTRPIYFAHFKSSFENLELFNTSTFNIDQLIQVPFSSIQSKQAPIITSSQLTGNNESLVAVGSTFIPNRKAKAIYNQATKQFRNLSFAQSPSTINVISPILDYSNLTEISSYITFPAQEVVSTFSNQKTEDSLVTTQSFFAPQWLSTSVGYDHTASATPNNVQWVFSSSFTTSSYVSSPSSLPLTSSIVPSPNNQNKTSVALFETGSSPSGDEKGYGLLYIQGYSMEAVGLYDYLFSPSQTYNYDIYGPHLQIMNNINKNIDNGNQAQPTQSSLPKYNTQPMYDQDDGISLSFTATTRQYKSTSTNIIPGPLPVLPDYADGSKGPANYFRYNYSQSALNEYNNKITDNITIDRGDIIRATYSRPIVYSNQQDTNLTKQKRIITKEFQVLGYELAAPEVLCNAGFGSSGAGTGFGTTNQDDTFFTTVDNLPTEGVFSPDVLNERYNMMATNTQSLFAYFTLTQAQQLSMWTGSVVSSKILYRTGEPDPTDANLVCITGSIELKLKTGQNGSAGSNPLGNPASIGLGTTQPAQRGTLNGKNVTSYRTLNNEIQKYQNAFYQFALSQANHSFDAGFMFDTLKVTPDPSKFKADEQILSGSIMAATLIKRKDNDTKVVLNLNQPTNQIGSLTPSGDGYLIPDDLTSTQMDNVQKIINVLKSQNSFTNPPDSNETQDVS